MPGFAEGRTNRTPFFFTQHPRTGMNAFGPQGGSPSPITQNSKGPQYMGRGQGPGLMMQPGRTPFGGLSGALNVGQPQRSPAFYTFMQALERGGQRSGIPFFQKPGQQPDFMGGMPDVGSPGALKQMAAPGLRPGWRGGMGMQTGAGFGGGRMNAMGLEPQMRMPNTRGLGFGWAQNGGRFRSQM